MEEMGGEGSQEAKFVDGLVKGMVKWKRGGGGPAAGVRRPALWAACASWRPSAVHIVHLGASDVKPCRAGPPGRARTAECASWLARVHGHAKLRGAGLELPCPVHSGQPHPAPKRPSQPGRGEGSSHR